MRNELMQFANEWEQVTAGTLELLRSLPVDKYDFRPDPGGRSLGELAWHLAELDAYLTSFVTRGDVGTDVKPPNIARPTTVDGLAPGSPRSMTMRWPGSRRCSHRISTVSFHISTESCGRFDSYCGIGCSRMRSIIADS